jgi:hypothetical protein
MIESTAQPTTMERALAFIESSDATAILDPEHRALGRASPESGSWTIASQHVVELRGVRKPGWRTQP